MLRCGRGEEGQCHLGSWGCIKDLAWASASLRRVLPGVEVTQLRHPITVFIVMVLAVIGIGVGVIAATTNQTVYGPSWGRFTAASFGSTLAPCSICRTVGPTTRRVQVAFYPSKGTLSDGLYVNVLVERDDHVEQTFAATVRAWGLDVHGSGSISTTDGNGFKIALFAPVCGRVQRLHPTGCPPLEDVTTNGRIIWFIGAWGLPTQNEAERVVASFEPIGG